MIRRIIESSLRLRVLVVAAAAVIMFVGVDSIRKMPVDVLPEFAPPYVEVQTEALGLSANEVEDLVTLNVEELLLGVPWLHAMRSRSVPGMSSIIMVFEPGTDIMRARQMVQERLTLAYALPNASKPPTMLQPLSATSRVMMVGLSSEVVPLIEMSVLTRWTIKPKLLGVPGVANVAVWGDRDRQLQVQIDPERLRAHGVTQQQVIQTAGNALWVSPLTFLEASFPGTGGWIDGPNQRLEVRHVLPVNTPDQLARVPVEGASVTLGEDISFSDSGTLLSSKHSNPWLKLHQEETKRPLTTAAVRYPCCRKVSEMRQKDRSILSSGRSARCVEGKRPVSMVT